MMDPELTTYIGLTTLLVATPGAATAVVVRNVLDGGRSQGLAAASGIAVANSTCATFGAIGAAGFVATFPDAFFLLRVAGGAYFALLGLRSLAAAWRGRAAALPGALETPGTHGAARDVRHGFLQGLTTNLVNPAIVTFYLTVVPSFLGGSSTLSRRYALFAVIHVSLALTLHMTWVVALHAMRHLWSRPSARRGLDTLTGVALLLLGAKVSGVV